MTTALTTAYSVDDMVLAAHLAMNVRQYVFVPLHISMSALLPSFLFDNHKSLLYQNIVPQSPSVWSTLHDAQ